GETNPRPREVRGPRAEGPCGRTRGLRGCRTRGGTRGGIGRPSSPFVPGGNRRARPDRGRRGLAPGDVVGLPSPVRGRPAADCGGRPRRPRAGLQPEPPRLVADTSESAGVPTHRPPD